MAAELQHGEVVVRGRADDSRRNHRPGGEPHGDGAAPLRGGGHPRDLLVTMWPAASQTNPVPRLRSTAVLLAALFAVRAEQTAILGSGLHEDGTTEALARANRATVAASAGASSPRAVIARGVRAANRNAVT